jgi:hypothetical protein
MSCSGCGKKIREKEDFVLTGKYPSSGQIWAKSTIKNRVPPEVYGTIYHMKCFFETFTESKASKP